MPYICARDVEIINVTGYLVNRDCTGTYVALGYVGRRQTRTNTYTIAFVRVCLRLSAPHIGNGKQLPIRTLFRHCSRREVEESDHRLQAIVGADNCEVSSSSQHRPIRWRKLPGEAQMAVVGIDRADLAKLMPCKARLNSLHHAVAAADKRAAPEPASRRTRAAHC